MLCQICNQFQGRWPIESQHDALKRRGQGVRSLLVPGWKWNGILQSAESCYVCDILVKGCRQCFDHHDIEEMDILTCSISFYYPLHDEEVETADMEKILSMSLVDGSKFEIEIFATDDDDCQIPDAWDYLPVSKRLEKFTDSTEALVKVKGWISECIENDSNSFCNSPELPELPSRVIDVGLGDETVRLVETNGKRANYICLSHCWGLEQIITTTNPTYEERKKEIAWKDLSNTFRDAITLTRRLGFEYIWIDSLCIKQDDARDWEIESAQMASIYSNGHLTIAATHSPGGSGGLFSQHFDAEIRGKSPDGEAYCLYFRQRIDHQIDVLIDSDGFNSTVVDYPLLSRAWVYQERMLSTRLLHFGRYEMFFECKSAIQCECGSIGYSGQGVEAEMPLVKMEYAETLSNYEMDEEELQNETAVARVFSRGAQIWRSMVCCYTALLLTKSKDRLPAIGGLARQMAAKRQSKYLAGLWADGLHDDLLWRVTSSRFKQPRPFPWNAPTWSWASVETFVHYEDAIVFSADESIEEPQLPRQHFAVIGESLVQPSAIDEYGSIAHGTVTITTLAAEGKLERVTEMTGGKEISTYYVAFSGRRLRMDADYLLDAAGQGHTPPSTEVYCLRMTMYQHPNTERLISLVVKKSSLFPNSFERIGALVTKHASGSTVNEGDIFDNGKLRSFAVV